jgi:hypothetical protein
VIGRVTRAVERAVQIVRHADRERGRADFLQLVSRQGRNDRRIVDQPRPPRADGPYRIATACRAACARMARRSGAARTPQGRAAPVRRCDPGAAARTASTRVLRRKSRGLRRV